MKGFTTLSRILIESVARNVKSFPASNLPSKSSFTPESVKSCPAFRFPLLVIVPDSLPPICNPGRILTVNSGAASGFVALNCKPFSNTKLSAVLAKNEPATSNRAFGPNRIPLGLIKNRFALPSTPKVPKIFEGSPPVIRDKIFSIPVGLLK